MKTSLCIVALLLTVFVVAGTDSPQSKQSETPKRPIVITLKTGETLKGNLTKVDADTVEFTVRNILQAVSLDEVASISFPVTPTPTPTPTPRQSAELLPANALVPTLTRTPIMGSKSQPKPNQIEEMGKNGVGRPMILSREKAIYTQKAKEKVIQGTVVLSVIFGANGKMANIKTIRGLPEGLTEAAIEAAKKIKFQPAMKDGVPVSVRGNLEFTFQLY